MKKYYEDPALLAVEFTAVDAISASGIVGNDPYEEKIPSDDFELPG